MLPVISDPESLTAPATGSRDETSATFDLLADRRRRIALRYLAESDSPVSFADLADHVALEERPDENGPIADLGDALLGTRRRVHVSLRHSHVPKLEEAGAVDVDPETNAVSLREPGAKLAARLDAIDELADE